VTAASAEPFSVRPARREDGPAFVALVRALAAFEQLPGPTDEAAARLCEHAFAAQPHYRLLVAETTPRGLCAYAAYFFNYSTFLAQPSLYLEDLFVHPDMRGRGVGNALMRRLAKVAVEHDCGRFEWTVLDWNERAQRYYRALGARHLPEWQIYRMDAPAIAALARNEP
jgi:ribosomal protein S18 acetylase RimI-like enzyme